MENVSGQFLGIQFSYWLAVLGIIVVLFMAIYFSTRKRGRGPKVDKMAGSEGVEEKLK